MSAIPTVQYLADAIDTFYAFVRANVLALNSKRVFGGIVQARDWPPKNIVDQSVYLCQMMDAPTRTRHQSFYAPLMTYTLEWRWAIIGTNVPANAQAANRGDKYRINMAIEKELLSAHNPGYTLKNQYSVGSDVDNDAIQVVVPYNPPEPLWWGIPGFSPKQDRTSGMLYTAGRVEVSSYAPISGNLG
jgi:hypothetical protein